jgi:hypothetical protein
MHTRLDLTRLPPVVAQKAQHILAALAAGQSLKTLKAKRFAFDRSLIRVPVTYRYRLLCRQVGSRIFPLKLLSHEAYNSIARNTRR